MPVVIAGSISFAGGSFNAATFAITFLAAAAVQIGLTMFNDTLDYVYGTDRSILEKKNPFSGGSGVLASGLIQPRQAMVGIVLLYLFALGCTLYFAFSIGPEAMWIAALGAAISILYSAKPFRFAYRGLGELMMFFGYGPVLTAWAYYIQTRAVNIDTLFVGAIPGMLMWTMILINEIPDYDEDKAANKRNIVYRLEPKNTKNLFLASIATIYIYIAVLLITKVLPVGCLLAFAGLPLAYLAGRAAHRHYRDPIKVAAANKYWVYTYSLTTLAIAAGFLLSH